MPTPEVIRLIEQFRRRLDALDAAAAADMIQAYGPIWTRISAETEALLAQIEGQQMTFVQVEQVRRYEELLLQARRRVDAYAIIAEGRITAAQREAVRLSLTGVQGIVDAALPAGIDTELLARVGITWTRLPVEAFEVFVGVAGDGGPLERLLRPLGAEASNGIREGIREGIALGRGPRETADLIRQRFGMPLTRSLAVSRTEMLRSYREASRLQYNANRDIVKGYRRHSARDDRVCFPAGVLIHTERGNIPIEQVRAGDRVLTHTGLYQRVAHTMSHVYTGYMVTIQAGERAVTSTGNHPFLVKRQGQLQWVEASDLRLGEALFTNFQRSRKVSQGVLGDNSIEWRGWQSQHPEPSALESQGFPCVLGNSLGPVVPIGLINLQHGVQLREIEVDGIAPSFDNEFLFEVDSQHGQGDPCASLGLGFSGEASVASWRAELLIGHCGDNPELPLAVLTGVDHGGTSAFLRAIRPIAPIGLCDDSPTSFTGNMNRISVPAGTGAMYHPLAYALLDGELPGALGACLGDGNSCLPAGFGTEAPPWGNSPYSVFLATLLAGDGQMRCYTLGDRRTSAAAKMPGVGLSAGGRELEYYPTGGASYLNALVEAGCEGLLPARWPTIGPMCPTPIGNVNRSVGATHSARAHHHGIPNLFHATSISSIANRRQGYTRVYNLAVEVDHTYIADGFVVHNCAACMALDGTEQPTDEILPTHVNCRCAMSPIPVTYRDLGLPVDQAPGDESTARDWFGEQSEATQRRMLGPGRFEAWQTGKVKLTELAKVMPNATWGPSAAVKTLAELGV